MILNSDDAERLRGMEDRLARIESRLNAYLAAVGREAEAESADLQTRFRKLAERWEAETQHLSFMQTMAMHPAYQEIIGMGPSVLPILLQEMRDQPGHWSWALRAISGTDPVPVNSRGKLKEAAAAWVAWGRAQGYIA